MRAAAARVAAATPPLLHCFCCSVACCLWAFAAAAATPAAPATPAIWTHFPLLLSLLIPPISHPALHQPCLLQVASATNDVAGDGTTTATVLTRAILVEGCKSVAAGLNPMDLRRGINLAVEHVVAELKARAKMISTTEEIAQVGWFEEG